MEAGIIKEARMAEVQCTGPRRWRRRDRRGIAFVRGLGIALALSLSLAMGACRSPSRDGRGVPSATGGASALSGAGGALGTSAGRGQ